MHRFKYEGKTNVGEELAFAFGQVLKEKNWFTDADVVIPIPLHISKEQRRGYNQSAHIANGLGEALGIPVRNRALSRTFDSQSQTNKSRYKRVENVDDVFQVNKLTQVRGKTILLVDDVVTTGATLEAAGNQLLKAGAKRLYIATLAVA